jgi:L-fuculose-phosphate aldolase
MWRHIQLEIAKYGRKLTERGFVCGHGGNISVRINENIYITRRGASLEDISARDIVQTPLKHESETDRYASSETPVHREIYIKTDYKAIIHAHPPYAIAVSYFFNEVEPLEIEAALRMGSIKVIEGKSGTRELGAKIVDNLGSCNAVIVRGHGVFAVGSNLEEAYRATCNVEKNCRQKYLTEILKAIGLKFIKPMEI